MSNLIQLPRILFTLLFAASHLAAANPLSRSTPEAQGVSSAALEKLLDTLDRRVEGMHSVMILRRGKVILEAWWKPYGPDHNHVLYSLSKSLASTAVGLAVGEGRLSVDDEVLKFFPNDAPAVPSANLKAMRVRDILTMTTGHQDEPPVAPNQISSGTFLSHPVPHLPGTHFKYNTPATFMQSAIVEKVTGENLVRYLTPRLFEPLGIKKPVWDSNFQGIALGGYGLRVRTEDIAKFGQLYLQRGMWNGKQLLPASWVDAATDRQVSNGSNPKSDWNQGYGFQFWRSRYNAYRGDGAFGQYCVVMPDQDAVVAITSGTKDMQAVLNILWEQLLPSFHAKKLRTNTADANRLAAATHRLKVPYPTGGPRSDSEARLLGRRFVFGTNALRIETLSITRSKATDSLELTMRIGGREFSLPCGYESWMTGRGQFAGGYLADFPDEPIAGSYGWTDANALSIKLCAYETPYHLMLTFRFDGTQVTLDGETNVGFGPTRKPTLIGTSE